MAYSILWRGQRDEALGLMRATIKRIPDGGTPLGLSAYCGAMNWMKGQGVAIDMQREVVPYIDCLIDKFPDRYSYRQLYIQMYQVLQNFEKVKEVGLATLEVMPDQETAMMAVGRASERMNQPHEAIAWYNRAIGAKPSYARGESCWASCTKR